jgi:hypothetical protein
MMSASLLYLVLLAQTPEQSPDPAALIEKMGSASYAEREAAKSLESLGKKALPALRAALKSKDAEVRSRAKATIKKIEGNLLLEATMVCVDFEDAPLEDAVASLSKQSGFEIALGQTMPDEKPRRVTLHEPRPISFWDAIDRLCEASQLGVYPQNLSSASFGGSKGTLVLAHQGGRRGQLSCIYGPFRMSASSLFYQSQIFLGTPAPMFDPLRPGGLGMAGVAKKANRPRLTPIEAGENAGGGAARSTQFQVSIQIVPEPRMTFTQGDSHQLVEAVDDLGNSLMQSAPVGERALLAPAFAPGGFRGTGATAVLTIPLKRPEKPGKTIKKLRGTVQAFVSAPRSNPLVIPIAGAVGKTFQDDDRRVVVNSVDTKSEGRFDVIELTIDDVDELFPDDAVMAGGFGPRRRMMGALRIGPVSGPGSQSPLQVITSTGQSAYCQMSLAGDSGRTILRVTRAPQLGEIKEIRIATLVRAQTQVPFEFHDLPMP